MEIIPTHNILKFRPGTIFELRKIYNLEKPGQMNEANDLLEDWVKKHEYIIKKDFSRDYLERAIILRKGSVERAKACTEQLCILKTMRAHAFDKYDGKKDFEYIKNTCSIVILPNTTEDNYRVLLSKIWNNDFTTDSFYDGLKFGGLLCEHLLGNDYAVGGTAIFDFRDIAISKLLATINLGHISETTAIFMKGYGFRLKGIHFVSTSTSIELVVKLAKKVLPTKISNRLFIHTELETLYDHVPKEILPAELNGHEKSIKALHDDWLNLLSTKENIEYTKEMFTKALVDKSYKRVREFIEENEELNGTFRTLCVD